MRGTLKAKRFTSSSQRLQQTFCPAARGGNYAGRAVTPSNGLDCQIVMGFGQNGRSRLGLSLLDEPFHMDAVNRGFPLLIALKEDLLAIGRKDGRRRGRIAGAMFAQG